MLNGRSILIVVLCALFVVIDAFGQDQSDSHIITVTKKIDLGKLNENVEDLNKNVKSLTETINKLNDTVDKLTVTTARLDERTKTNSNLLYILIAGVFGIPLVQRGWSRWMKRNDKDEGYIQETATHTKSPISPTFDSEVMNFNPSPSDSGPRSNRMGGNSQ